MSSGWQLSSSAPLAYQRHIVPTIFEPWARQLARTARARPDETVVDVACGTGIVGRTIADAVPPPRRVIGIDLNEGMLAVASGLPAAQPIEWLAADASSIPLDDASADVVVCQQGLQYFADRPAALREIKRLLRPGGRALASVWRSLDHQPFFSALVAGLCDHLPDEVVALQRAAFSLGEAADLETLCGDAGFGHVTVRVETCPILVTEPLEFLSGYLLATPMAAAVAALSGADRQSLILGIIDALEPHRNAGGISVQTEVNLIEAQTSPDAG